MRKQTKAKNKIVFNFLKVFLIFSFLFFSFSFTIHVAAAPGACVGDRYWVGGSGNWSDATNHWATSTGGTPNSANTPTTSTAVCVDSSSGSPTITIDATANALSFSITAANAVTITGSAALNVNGALYLATGTTWTYTGAITFGGSTGGTITTNGVTLANDIIIDASKTFSLAYDLNDSTNSITLTNGSFSTAGYTLTAGSFSSNNSNTRGLTLGASTINLGGTGGWTIASGTFTLTANTSTIKFTSTTGDVTFTGGGKTYGNIWFARGASTGTDTIVDTNTFADFKDDGTAAHTIVFPNVTTTVSSFTVSGTAGNLITLARTGGSGTFTLSDGGGTNSSDYLSISNSTVTGGASWYAGTNSNNGGGNTGWNFSAPTATTTLGNGTDGGNSTIGPGASATEIDRFSLVTNVGTDTVTGMTVTLAGDANAYTNIATVGVQTTGGVSKCSATPSSNTVLLTSCAIAVTTGSTEYKILITPKTHANMPAVPGASYATTATVTSITATNGTAGTDSGSATITVDNASPADVTSATATGVGGTAVNLAWTNPADSDFTTGGTTVVLRRATSAVADVPVEGTTYTVGNTIGTATVACVVTGSPPTAMCQDTGLTAGTAYNYKIFTEDSRGNYSSTGVVPTGSPVTPAGSSISLRSASSAYSPSNSKTGVVVQTGDLIVVGYSYSLTSINSVTCTDNAAGGSNTYTQIAAINGTSANGYNPGGSVAHMFWASAKASETLTITCTAKSDNGIHVHVVSGIVTTNPVDQYATNMETSAVTSHTTPTLNTTNPNDYLIVYWAQEQSSRTMTTGDGFVKRTEQSSHVSHSFDKIVSATGAYSHTAISSSTAQRYLSIIAAFKGLPTTLGNGTDGSNSTIGPGASATEIDRFSLVTNVGTDTVTGMTVTLAGDANAYTNIATVDVQTTGGVSKCSATPSSNTVLLTSCAIAVTTGSTEYKILITPKTHANMPAVPGASYDTTATVTSITATNGTAGTDSGSATITVDNLSPAEVTSATATPGNTQVSLAWTNPADSDFTTGGTTVVLRRATSAVADVPVEGTTYTVGNTIGTATVACVVTGSPPTASCTDTSLSNGTAYNYKIFTQDSRGNYSSTGVVPTGSPATPIASTTTLGNGTDGSNSTIGPGASATEIDRFSLVTNVGTDTVTGMTVTLAGDANAYTNIATVDVQTTGGVSKCSATPSSNTVLLTSCAIAVTTGSTEYKILITPKTHANMPAVPGASYDTTATVTSITATNGTAGTDSGSATITVDNLSPAEVTSATATPGNTQVSLAWTNPADSDFTTGGTTVVLRRATSAVADVPVEGTTYTVGNTIGTATVACVVTGSPPTASCTDTSLSNGTAYNYKIFTQDSRGNYSSTGVVPTGSPATPIASTTTLGNGTDGSNSTIGPGASATEIDRFSLVTNVGTDTVTGMTVTLAGDANAYTNIATVDVQTTGGVSKCSATPSSNTVLLTSCAIAVTTGSTEYKILITPKTHANMPAVPGASYDTTATVTSITATNGTAGTDSGSATITVDNLSPAEVTSATATPGNTQVSLAWTNPADSDFTTGGTTVVLRRATSAVADVPVEGTTYTVGNTIGTATVACVVTGSPPTASCTDTSLSNGTAYNYKIFTQDSRGNYSSTGVVPTGSPATPIASTTTLGNGTDGSNSTIGPGASATEIDRFSLVTNTGTDTVTGMTVTLAGDANAYTNIATVDITTAGPGGMFCSTTPTSNTVLLTSCNISVTTSPSNYKVRITPKTHANMPAVPGASYDTTATVTSITATNGTAGTDSGSATITVDNLSPAEVTSATATPGNTQVSLAWTNPADSDFTTGGTTVVLRRATSAVADVPVEGTTYTVGNTIGTATVACVVTGSPPTASCTDTSLSNGTAYNYKIFTQDSRGNYSSTGVVPTGSPATPIASTTTLGNGTDGSNSTIGPGASATEIDRFSLVTNVGTDTVTGMTVTLAGDANAYTNIATVDVQTTGGVSKCSATPSSNTVLLTSCAIAVTTGSTEYKILITPKTHANMPAVPGASYATTATVTSITATNGTAGTDSGSATITVDNASPADVTSATATGVGGTAVNLAWTNPADSDFTTGGTTVVLRRATSAVADVPVEGTTYTVGNTIGTATVACVVTGSPPTAMCQDTGLTAGTAYNYKIFTEDSRGNYSSTGVVPTGSPVTPAGAGISLRAAYSTYTGNAQTGVVVQTGDLIVVGFLSNNPSSPAATVTDNAAGGSNTYTQVATVNAGGGSGKNDSVWMFYAIAKASETLTVTFNVTSPNDPGIHVHVVSGIATSNPVDQFATRYQIVNGTTFTTGTMSTTSNANDYLMVMWGQEQTHTTMTSSDNFVKRTEKIIHISGTMDSIVSSTGAYSHTMATDVSVNKYLSIIAAFKGLPTTLGNGTDGSNSTIGPGASATEIDRFSLVTNVGTDTVTGMTVTLAGDANAYTNIATVDVQTTGGVSKCSATPSSNTVLLTSCAIAVTTGSTEYKILITPKTHANMPAVPGASYDTTATVTSITATNGTAGTDSGSATITVDNLSPAEVTSATATPGNTQVSLAWTNPADSDFTTGGTTVVLRRATSAVADVPVEGTTYTVGNTIGTATVACVITGSPPTASCTDTSLSNGTAYNYKIFTQDSRGNYSSTGVVPTGSPATPIASTTTLGNGTDGSNSTIGPGASATEIDRFSLVTNVGTDTVTGMTVTLAGDANAYTNIATVDVQTTGGVSKCSATPSSNTVLLTSCAIAVTTGSTEYKILITPKTHANMPAVPGASYATTATVTSITATNGTAGTDSGSATITVDNLSPAEVTSATATPGNTQVSLAWTNPADSDFTTGGTTVVLRRATSAVADVPVEGTTYTVGNTIGTATVACVITGSPPTASCTDTSLSNGTAYNYKIFTQDSRGNYSSTGVVPTGSPATPVVTTLGNGTDGGNSTIGPRAYATEIDRFSLVTSSGTDTVTGMTVTLGPTNAYNNIATVAVQNLTGSTSSFNALNATGATKLWLGISVNPSNGDVYAVAYNGDIYKQTAGTGSFNALNATGATKSWSGISVNPSNGDVYAVVYNGDIYKQTAGTGSFNALNATGATKSWRGISVNPSNGDVYAGVFGGDIYKQTAGTGSFNALNATGGSNGWYGVSVNPSNGDVYAVVYNGDIYKQTAGTGSFNALNATGATKSWPSISVNPSNGDVYAGVDNGDIYKQTAGTGSFNALNATGATKYWRGISVNPSNGDVYAGNVLGDIYKQNGSYCSATPSSNTVLLTSCAIAVTTGSTEYKILITPKTHANMPAVPGASYDTTATVTSITATNGTAGTDSGSATITVDNLSPAEVTSATATPGNTQVSLAWTNPADSDFTTGGTTVVLRRATSAVADVPVEGTTYTVGNTIGTATVACVVTGSPPTASCTDTSLSNGTAYNYKIFTQDSRGNYSSTGVVPTGSPATPIASTTTLGNGTDGSNSTIGPGASATEIDRFSLVTNVGTDTVTGMTVTLAGDANAYTNIATVDVQTTGGVSKCSATPSSNTVLLTSCAIAVTTGSTEYKILITPKTHANMPAVPGASYDTTATVTSITATNGTAGTDSGSATITVDNLSPAEVTSATATPGNTQVSLAWTNPADSDFTTGGTTVVLRRATSAVADVPVEGTTYTVGNTIGTATVACVVTGSPPTASCTDTSLSNGTAYNYKIFTQDSRGNYSSTGVVPTGSPAMPNPIGWYDSSWVKRIKITTTNASATSNEQNFPVLVQLNSSRITYSDFQTSGTDIRFVSSDNSTVLPYELEKWDTNGTSSLWVKVPYVSTSSYFYMYYDNLSATTDTSSPTSVWDSNFQGVWHLKETGTGSVGDYKDSLGVNNSTNTTGQPSATTGKIDGGENFVSASSQYITMGNVLNIGTNDFTLSAWIKPPNVNSYSHIISKRKDTSNFNQYDFGTGDVTNTGGSVNSKKLFVLTYDGSTFQNYKTTNDIVDGNWHHAEAVRQSGVAPQIYVDGVTVPITAVNAGTTNLNITNTNNFNLGFDNASTYYTGDMDEVRVSFSARSANWIWDEYKAGADTLNTYNTVENYSPPNISLTHYRFKNDDGGEVNASYSATQDNAISSAVSLGDRIRLRFLVSNIGGTAASNYTYQIEDSSGSCTSWTAIPTSTDGNPPWVVSSSGSIANNGATTNSSGLTDPGGGSFVAGYTQSSSNITPALTLQSNQFTELEYALRSTANASIGTTYCFRLTNAGSTTNFTYTTQPQIVLTFRASKGGGGSGGIISAEGLGTGGGTPVSGGTGQGGGSNGATPPAESGSGGGTPVNGGTGQGGGGGEATP